MSNALASRYTVPSNGKVARTKSRRRKFKDVDLLEPCVVNDVLLKEAFGALRDKCTTVMNIPTTRDEQIEVGSTPPIISIPQHKNRHENAEEKNPTFLDKDEMEKFIYITLIENGNRKYKDIEDLRNDANF